MFPDCLHVFYKCVKAELYLLPIISYSVNKISILPLPDIKNANIFKQGDSSVKRKMKDCVFQQILLQNVSWFSLNIRKCLLTKVSF